MTQERDRLAKAYEDGLFSIEDERYNLPQKMAPRPCTDPTAFYNRNLEWLVSKHKKVVGKREERDRHQVTLTTI